MTNNNTENVFRKMYTYATFTAEETVKKKFLSAKIDNLHVVFFNPDDKFPVKSFSKIVLRKNLKTGAPFHGIKSGKYGARVPQDATHMSLAIFGSSKIERLYTMEIPRPFSKTTVRFGDNTNFVMLVRRSNTNIFMTIGDTLKVPTKSAKKVKAHKDINQKWIQL